ncbi:hypothetical protein PMAYCL1PPCAC_08451 [Pristionchus mayeri]|uniref:Uncharacterized protein n=1 Tax=Pristionchus mayeri TaxID=1317129 RepID=A0AAN5CE23_9BILA|nr:hypothetical protein PMAYCL1PPCAC_08451 [Pristionchus mayeri]
MPILSPSQRQLNWEENAGSNAQNETPSLPMQHWSRLARLERNESIHQLMNVIGASFLLQTDQDGKAVIGNRKRAGYYYSYVDTNTFTFAGELNKFLYFYTLVEDSEYKYLFYSCHQMSSCDWLFTIVHELSVGNAKGPLYFAVQQPYFLQGKFIISFTGQIIKLQAEIQGSQAFFCQRWIS